MLCTCTNATQRIKTTNIRTVKKKNKKIRIMLLGTKKLVEQKWLEEDFFYCICPFIINRKQFNCPVHLQHNKKNTEGSEKT